MDTLFALIRITLLYVGIVGSLFAGLTMLTRAEAATRDTDKLLLRFAIYGLYGLYIVTVIVFVFRPMWAIAPAIIAVLSSIALGAWVMRGIRFTLSETEMALLFILPAVTGVILFFYYQIAQTLVLSFHDLKGTTRISWETYIGLENYLDVFDSRRFLGALRYTLYFTGVAVFLEFWIGLGMAMATFEVHRRYTGILRSMIVIPWAIPPIISAAIWKWLFNPDVGVGKLMEYAGIVQEAPLFLVDPWLAMHSIILADVWKMSSMIAILLIGGLAIIPNDVYDAAKVDGARAWMRFRRITLPLLTPTIMVALLFRSMDALRTFDLVFGLTNGGPGTSTETLSSFAYKFYFTRTQFGIGSAYSIVIFLLIMILSFFYISRLRGNLRFKQ